MSEEMNLFVVIVEISPKGHFIVILKMGFLTRSNA